MLGGGSCMSGEVAEIASYPRHREARSAVAIQGRAAGVCHAALDRHASLAMTEPQGPRVGIRHRRLAVHLRLRHRAGTSREPPRARSQLMSIALTSPERDSTRIDT